MEEESWLFKEYSHAARILMPVFLIGMAGAGFLADYSENKLKENLASQKRFHELRAKNMEDALRAHKSPIAAIEEKEGCEVLVLQPKNREEILLYRGENGKFYTPEDFKRKQQLEARLEYESRTKAIQTDYERRRMNSQGIKGVNK